MSRAPVSRRGLLLRGCGVLAALLLWSAGAGGAQAGPGGAGVAAGAAGAEPGQVVLVGAPGLAWSDIGPGATPVLWRLATEGAVGSLTVRSVRSRSCEIDGWLTLSAGRRAADEPGGCRPPGGVAGGRVVGWERYVAAARSGSYGAVPGTLGRRVGEAGGCVAADGLGAAIGAAEEDGRVAAGPCRVLLAGVPPLPVGQARGAALRDLDALVGLLVRDPDPGRVVLVAGTGDGVSPVVPRAVLAAGAGIGRGLLTSPSTRQPGLVQLQDLTATLLVRSGADGSGLAGRPVLVEASEQDVASRVADRVGLEVRAGTLRAVAPQVTGWLAAAFALWCAVAALALRRRHPLPGRVAVAGVAVATVPVATVVANLVPWWAAGRPALAFAGALAVTVAVLTAAAVVAGRRRPLGALLVIAVLTLVVLGGDVLTGSRLQLASVFGQNPTVGGRFYGIGNTSYALYGVAVLAVLALLAHRRHSSPWESVGLPVLLLIAATVLEGHPLFGADFGGPPGLLLGGLAVLAAAWGLRTTPVRVALAVAGAAMAATAVAVLDWLRPAASRTHLGEFVETVRGGGLEEVVGRKLAQNLANLGSPPLLTITVGTVVLAVLAWRAGWRPSPPGSLLLRGVPVLAAVGFAVNDSGLVIPAYAALTLAPLLLADPASVVGGGLDELDEDPTGVLGVDEVDP